MWSGILDAAIQYGDYSEDTSFILGGMEKGISGSTSGRDTLYFDTSGIYQFDPINTEGKDSIAFNWYVSNNSLTLEFRTDSSIGKGNWTDADTGINYPISIWTQIKIDNALANNQWIDSLSYILNAIDTTIFDTFPYQKEIITFNLPVSDLVPKAAWGIYYPSGRSIILDERYIYSMNDSLTVVTDKGCQVLKKS